MSYENSIFLGFGSNIENRYDNIKQGVLLLNEHPHIWVIKISHIYESKAMYNINQDNFYNLVIEIESNLTPVELLQITKSIESKFGRRNILKKNMPRKLDIDILSFTDNIINTNILNIPHPGIIERIFVLKPWNDIAPDYKLPTLTKTINDLLTSIENDKYINRLLITDEERII